MSVGLDLNDTICTSHAIVIQAYEKVLMSYFWLFADREV